MKSRLIFTVLSLIAVNSSIFSQPKAIVQFNGGYSMPLGDLKGDFGETFATWTNNPDSNTYFMHGGANYGIYVKFPIKLKSPINIIGGVYYNSFSNSASYNDTAGRGTFDYGQRILTFSIGTEYSYYSKRSKFMPYAGVEIMVNVFGGSLTVEEPSTTTEFTMNSTIRLGLQFGAGCDYILHQNIGLTLGAKYAMANLIGKTYKEDLGTKYNLGDGEHTIGTSYYPDKYINYLQFYGGISFYFGR